MRAGEGVEAADQSGDAGDRPDAEQCLLVVMSCDMEQEEVKSGARGGEDAWEGEGVRTRVGAGKRA